MGIAHQYTVRSKNDHQRYKGPNGPHHILIVLPTAVRAPAVMNPHFWICLRLPEDKLELPYRKALG